MVHQYTALAEERRTVAAATYEKGAEMAGWVGVDGGSPLVEEQTGIPAVVVL